jgi:hypothetical protein
MNKQGNVGVIVAVVVGLAILVGGYFAVQVLLRPAPTGKTGTSFTNAVGDIDRSGTVDESDKSLVRGQSGCLKTQPCWNQTVGKTKDGDNPIYVSDLDLNKDGFVDQQDLDLVK